MAESECKGVGLTSSPEPEGCIEQACPVEPEPPEELVEPGGPEESGMPEEPELSKLQVIFIFRSFRLQRVLHYLPMMKPI